MRRSDSTHRGELCWSCDRLSATGWRPGGLGLMALVMLLAGPTAAAQETALADLTNRFHRYSGARLVFDRQHLPPGTYYDVLTPLSPAMRIEAAEICLRQAKMYPPQYFAEVGLKAIGLFEACVSKQSDGYRAYDTRLKGYRYYGIYNGSDAIVSAFYDDPQLEFTFHHELFHHIDSTVGGSTEAWHLSGDDAPYHAAISGFRTYDAIEIANDDIERLRKLGRGTVLQDSFSDYAAKNAREDQAETARYLMYRPADALRQAAERPELPGSQRIIHVLREYELSVADGPGVDWFVDVAVGRAHPDADALLRRMQRLGDEFGRQPSKVARHTKQIRSLIRATGRLDPDEVTPRQAGLLIELSGHLTEAILRERIRPNAAERRFVVWGPEDEDGVNWTLRRDVKNFGLDAVRLQRVAALDADSSTLVLRTQLRDLRLIARYYEYIASQWSVTAGTRKRFEGTVAMILRSLPAEASGLTDSLGQLDLNELGERIDASGETSAGGETQAGG